MKLTGFAKYAWGVLSVNLGVILWGAYVRASGSGAGCGSHWPLCNGEVIPRAPRVETLIELAHRLSSGLALVLVVGLFILAFRQYPKGHWVRRGASLAMLFILTEAAVGAGLVLLELVAHNQSLSRAVWMAGHLINTFLLLGSLTLTAWWASGGQPLSLERDRPFAWLLALGILGVMVLGVSGALAALGDTLFPASSLVEGVRQDFTPGAHFLIRLRLLHPAIAITVSIYLILLTGLLNLQKRDAPGSRVFARLLAVLIAIQVSAGFLNVALLAPIGMQVIHLLLADLLWVALILYSANRLAKEPVAGRRNIPAERRMILEER